MKPRTLIVDDSPELRGLLSLHLGERGCEVVHALESGHMVEKTMWEIRPDLVFLDVNMPGKDGLSLGAQLRKVHPHCYIVIMSADHHDDNVRRAKLAGAHDFLVKPYSTEKLNRTVARYRNWKENQKMPRIIVVDDEELARDYLKSMLSELGLPVAYEASNAADAMQAVMSYQPDLLFLDIEMPDKNGIEVLKHIKQAHAGCFVIMVSGHSTFENLRDAMDHGAASFIVKPYTRKKLEQVIKLYQDQTPAANTA